MSRIKLKKHLQIRFLDEIRKELRESNWVELAKALKVHKRCLSDWKRGKYTLPENVFKKCIKLTKEKIEAPPCKVLPDFWSVKKAGRKSWNTLVKRYGGVPIEICRKGGLAFAEKRRLYPELYQHCYIGKRKNILIPSESTELAEFLGIILGDGGISDNQVIISLNKENDKSYVFFIFDLIKNLFKINPSVYHYHTFGHKNNVTVTISSRNVVDFLLSKGLKKGNKVKQQAGVPPWIKDSVPFSKSCLRGLIDTDGCIYSHRHTSHGYQHFNIGLNFSNKSTPLLIFVKDILISLGFNAKIGKRNVNLYREMEVNRYAKEIGFSNPYHRERLEKFLKIKHREGYV